MADINGGGARPATLNEPSPNTRAAGSMLSPQEEAIQLFAEAARSLTEAGHELKRALRKCQLACQILNWLPARDWFQHELAGSPPEIPVSPHRHLPGRRVWQLRGSAIDSARRELEQQLLGPATQKEGEEEDDEFEFRGDFDFLLACTKHGWTITTGEVAEEWDQKRHKPIRLERVRSFPAGVWANALATLERITFDFASQQYAFLRYGNVLSDIWQDYRRQVDGVLQGLRFTPHFEQIQVGLQSDNPEGWRTSVYECRAVLEDLANQLWRDPRPVYPYIKNTEGKDLDVRPGRFTNRLSAYLHQKGGHGKEGKLAREEAQRLGVSIRALAGVQGKAHAPVTMQAARAVAITTYVLLGELVTKTDMQPLEEYKPISGDEE